LLADQALEDLPDHRKMRRIQPLCEQPRDEKGDLRVGSEKALRIVEEINLRRSSRCHGDRVRPIHEQRHPHNEGPVMQTRAANSVPHNSVS